MKIRTVSAMTTAGWLLLLAVLAILIGNAGNNGHDGDWGPVYVALVILPPFIGLYLAALGLNVFCVSQGEVGSKAVGGVGLALALIALLWVVYVFRFFF
jgi:hypothetical protein